MLGSRGLGFQFLLVAILLFVSGTASLALKAQDPPPTDSTNATQTDVNRTEANRTEFNRTNVDRTSYDRLNSDFRSRRAGEMNYSNFHSGGSFGGYRGSYGGGFRGGRR